jgi:hypothetical protein
MVRGPIEVHGSGSPRGDRKRGTMMGLLSLGGHALSHLGDNPLSVVGPARRLAQHLGWNEGAEGLRRLNWYKSQANAREYAQQLQAEQGTGGSDDGTSEDTEIIGAPGDGGETIPVDAPSGSGVATPVDDADRSLLGGVGRAVHSVREWISDAW